MRRRLVPIQFNTTPAAPSFVPTDLSGLKMWLDFSDATTLFQDAARTSAVTADGQEILGVADKSGVGNHLSGATGTSPVYKVNIQNGKSIALFDGVDNLLSGSITAMGRAHSIIMVYQFIAAGGTGEKFVFLLNAGTGDANRVIIRNRADSRQRDWAAVLTVAFSASFVADSLIGNTTNAELFRNGASQGSAAQGAGAVDATMIYLGSERGAGAYANVRYGELLIYDSALSPTDRAQVETYLNTKWTIY